MAGYVAVNLLKKSKKGTKNPAFKLKRRLFVKVLEKMKATQQPTEPDTLLEYTTHWSELIDRGGLYHISDDVFRLVESIEMIVRGEMNTKHYTPGGNVCVLITKKVIGDQDILSYWDTIINDSIPLRYEQYSIELLEKIVHLWVTIRLQKLGTCNLKGRTSRKAQENLSSLNRENKTLAT